MLKQIMKKGMTAMLSMVMLSSYWDLPYSGPCVFFFGEPIFPIEINDTVKNPLM